VGHIPDDAEWFVAELIMEITVAGADRNVVHRDLVLISAKRPESAYERALDLGQQGEVSYENPKGQSVQIKFRGISRLDVVSDPLEDGSELTFEELVDVSEDEILRWIPPKSNLEAFRPPPPFGISRKDPDYSSRVVIDKVMELIRKEGKTPLS
jgi:hypothetical protein